MNVFFSPNHFFAKCVPKNVYLRGATFSLNLGVPTHSNCVPRRGNLCGAAFLFRGAFICVRPLFCEMCSEERVLAWGHFFVESGCATHSNCVPRRVNLRGAAFS